MPHMFFFQIIVLKHPAQQCKLVAFVIVFYVFKWLLPSQFDRSGGPKFEYLWADGCKYKKPTKLPAPQYISLLMDWSEAQINNESLFPVSCGE